MTKVKFLSQVLEKNESEELVALKPSNSAAK